MPELVRLYIRNVLYGVVLSLVFVALLLWLNVANLWHLVSHNREGWVAVLMLVIFNAVVFSGVQFAIAVMRMAEPDDTPPGGRRQRRGLRLSRLPFANPAKADLARAPAHAPAAKPGTGQQLHRPQS